jgi:hypothetical protein
MWCLFIAVSYIGNRSLVYTGKDSSYSITSKNLGTGKVASVAITMVEVDGAPVELPAISDCRSNAVLKVE